VFVCSLRDCGAKKRKKKKIGGDVTTIRFIGEKQLMTATTTRFPLVVLTVQAVFIAAETIN
jgi:hypothetical protein